MPNADLPVLYSFRRCPYAMRARLALQVSGLRYAQVEVALQNKPPELLQLSPKGTVPVLWVPSQDLKAAPQVIDQSLDIMLWALAQHDPERWLPSSEQRMQACLQTIERNDGFFKHHLDRYKYPQRFGLSPSPEHRDLACGFLRELDTRLQAHGFLDGPHWGLADTALAPFVRQFARVDLPWFQSQNWHALSAWLSAFEASPAFVHTLQKTTPPGLGTPVLFPPLPAVTV